MATLYKRGTSYYLNWREGGVQYRRSLGQVDRRAAETIQAEKAAELRGLLTPTRGVTVEVVLAGYVRWYEANRPATYRRALSALKPLRADLGHYAAESMPPGAFEAWASAQASSGSAEKALKLARAAFRRAVAQRTIARSPMEGVCIPKSKISRAPDYYRPKQLDLLYAAARGPLWAFMVATGIRRGEMAKARRADVQNGLLLVESTAQGRTKSGKWRAVPLNRQAKDALASLGKDRLVECHPDTLSDWFVQDAHGSGLPGSLHWLRHTFCTALVQSGVTLHEVKRLAGHSSITVTEQYAHHCPDFGRAAVATMDGWMRGGETRKAQKKAQPTRKTLRPRSSAG